MRSKGRGGEEQEEEDDEEDEKLLSNDTFLPLSITYYELRHIWDPLQFIVNKIKS